MGKRDVEKKNSPASLYFWRGGLDMETAFPVSLVIRSALAREGLKRILVDNGFHVRQSAADPEALDATAHQDEHIVIFESALLPAEPLRAVRDMLEDAPYIRLILLDDHFDFELMSRAFQAGIHAYVLQDTKPETLLYIIQIVSLGEKVAPAELIEELKNITTHPRNINYPKSYGLSNREKDILDCLALGMPNKIISRKMDVSEATVKLTIKNIFRKMNVKNRTQAAMLAHDAMESFSDNQKVSAQTA